MRKILNLLGVTLSICFVVLMLVGCGGKSSEEKPVDDENVTQTSTNETPVTEETIKITAIGLEDPVTMVKNFAPLCDYLSKEIGKKVEFIPSSDYEKAVQGLEQGTVDIAHLGPVTYVQAHDKFKAEALVKAIEGKDTEYSSVIFVRDDSAVKDVKGLMGKKVAFGDKDSMSSNCAPKYLMYNEGVKESDLAEAKNFTSQDEVISQVLNKNYDAGAVKESIFEKNKDKGIKILGKQEHIPTFAITAREGLDAKLKEDIKNALLKLKDVEILKAVDKKYTGFTSVTDEDYAWVREAMVKLDIK
ncbi:MAG: hypothetical protein A2Y18_03195 [Clostridiales bacterium GWD2_32_19]|nr:MAG: hypothetical protein A2Y18_03195 [Clostridiales bacterium GWD2_32_19]